MINVQSVSSRADLKRFIKYPFKKYTNDPHWVPPLLISERQKFNPKKNPFYEHARVDLFLAERAGEVVGRIAAIGETCPTLAARPIDLCGWSATNCDALTGRPSSALL